MVMARKKKQPVHSINSLQSKFHTTIAQSHRFKVEEDDGELKGTPPPPPPEDESPPGGQRGSGRRRFSEAEHQTIARQQATQRVRRNPQQAIRDLARSKTRVERYMGPPSKLSEGEHYQKNYDEAERIVTEKPTFAIEQLGNYTFLDQRYIPSSRAGGPTGPARSDLYEEISRPHVSKIDKTIIQRGDREFNWRTQGNIYRTIPKDRKSLHSFMIQEMAPSHREWLEKQLVDSDSEFNRGLVTEKSERAKTGRFTSAQRRRAEIYTNALQRGESHEQAMQRVRSSSSREGVGRPSTAEYARTRLRTLGAEATAPPRASGRPTRFTSVQPTPGQFKIGIDSARRPSLDEIKKKFPDYTEQEQVRIQQAATENITHDMIANQRWGHETRRANLIGSKSGRSKAASDKVTIFTTNIGHPAVSVPTDSLVGQYIIKKRRAVFGSYGVPASQLRGPFPDVLRDQHVVDVAMGSSFGVQGRQGVFTDTGYRIGKKASPGYGKPRPLGGQILTDTAGRPLYDEQGNIKYTEGATRRFDWTTPNLGFRILMG